MDYKLDPKKACITRRFKHKFSIDAILGIPQTVNSESSQHLNHLRMTACDDRSQQKTGFGMQILQPPNNADKTNSTMNCINREIKYLHPQSAPMTGQKIPNSERVQNPLINPQTPCISQSSTDRFWQTLSILNTCTPTKPNGLDSTRLVSTERTKNRSPRIPFSRNQLQTLEKKFQQTHYLSGWEVNHLAKKLNLSETRVKIWFQNRRARERRDTGILNSPNSANHQTDLKSHSETNIQPTSTRWSTLNLDQHSSPVTLRSNHINYGSVSLTNATNLSPVHIPLTTLTTTNPYVSNNVSQYMGYPMTYTNWDPSINQAYYPAFSLKPVTDSIATLSSRFMHQSIPEQFQLDQTSFWKPYFNIPYPSDPNTCNTNLIDEKEFS